jgi:exopolyphosphatase / guanosine-5'-triphosphate,3'-diphosphate pyrophosphatase
VPSAIAAFDCGSNSTRLLIAGGDGQALERRMHITRLSQGVDATGAITPEAMDRTLRVLSDYRRLCDDAGVERGLLVATSAVRDASNGSEFLERAHEITRVESRILSGNEEATLSLSGALGDLEESPLPTMIVDVGGGSTELATRADGEILSYSMQLGCVRVTERALGKEIVTPERDAATRAMITSELDTAFVAVPGFQTLVGAVRLVGLAGTVATLAQLDTGLSVYDRDAVHHRELSLNAVTHWRDLLASEPVEVRLTHPGMVPGREDVLAAGLYVLAAVMERFQVETLLSSENDILDGIVLSLRP